MGGTPLIYSESIKYLGVVFSKRGTWTPHIKSRIAASKFLLHKTKAVVGGEWGLSPDKLLWILTAVIRPRISYGSLVWAHEITKTHERSLGQLQRLMLSRIARCARSIPVSVLEVTMGITPLPLHLKECAVLSWARVKDFLTIRWPGIDHKGQIAGHRKLNKSVLSSIPGGEERLDVIRRYKNWRSNPVLEADGETLHVYTDGSKLEERAGYGWLVTLGDEVLEEDSSFLGNTTVFSAELAAIFSAAKWLVSMRIKLSRCGGTRRRVIIHSDSQSAIQAIFAPHVRSDWVHKTAEELDRVKNFYELEVRWIRAHVGTVGNECADMLAKKGAVSEKRGPVPSNTLVLAILKGSIRNYFDTEWQRRWRLSEIACHARKMIKGVDRMRKVVMSKLTTDSIKRITQFISGHGPFGGHIKHWVDIDPRCKLCEDGEELPWHWITECRKTPLVRGEITIKTILSFSQLESIESCMKVNASKLREGRDPTLTSS